MRAKKKQKFRGEDSNGRNQMEEALKLSDFEMTNEEKEDLYSEGANKEAKESMKGANWFRSCVGDKMV